MLAQKSWERILSHRLDELGKVKGIILTSRHYMNKYPDFTLGLDGGWKTKGYEQINFELRCPAIMDCNPSKKEKAYLLNASSSILVKNRHELTFLFPRGYPDDAVKWAFYFRSAPPMYPNIINVDIENAFNMFNKSPPRGGGDWNGTICIGEATSDTSIARLAELLYDYLLLKHEPMFILKGRGGVNDGGFDLDLMEHFTTNYKVLKKALNPERRTLGDTRKRRKLGK
jgi:hypothetical protein